MTAGRLSNEAGGGQKRTGSALILTVVLTSLLALVGVLFVMAARLDKMGTTAASESRELDFAVDTVVAQITEVLAEDVPGVSDNQEYYDYPDANNLWLADLEPSSLSAESYHWRQISNLIGAAATETRDVTITLVDEHEPIIDVNSLASDANDAIVDVNSFASDADADGDGVSDARWYRIPGIMSSRGKPLYAAVRIIDNGGMLNINTGYWFNDTELTQRYWVDGSSLSQINVAVLAGGVTSAQEGAKQLLEARSITDLVDGLADYEARVTWGGLRSHEVRVSHSYTPFDLSDELELRYRYILNHTGVDTLAETWGRFRDDTISTPVDANIPTWFLRTTDALDPNMYAYRHIATTYNMDRIITPKPIEVPGRASPWKMVNVNRQPADEKALHEAVFLTLAENDPNTVAVEAAAAQITANLLDYIDDDDDRVTAIENRRVPDDWYYGFERPCVYISEIACHFVVDAATGEVHKSYAIELYKPYFEDNDPRDGQWQLVITLSSGDKLVEPIEWSGTRRFHVMLLEDPAAELFDNSDFSDPTAGVDTTPYERTRYADPNAQEFLKATEDGEIFDEGSTIALQRWSLENQKWVADVDFVEVPTGWMDPNAGPQSIQRDVSPHQCIRRIWSADPCDPGLGRAPEPNLVAPQGEEFIQAHPANRPLATIGELGMVFATSAYDGNAVKDAVATEVLLDLSNPDYARLFSYLTVMDPDDHGWDQDETRVMGRINVNTAPWFVLGQLPWMRYEDQVPFERAKAVVADRNANGPYTSTADLMRVATLGNLALDGPNQNWYEDDPRGPDVDLVPDTALNDLEERDLIFQRISNLTTVRSDVFTAYILVRIGVDGPQRRMMAILNRSDVTPEGGQVRIVALQPVADPR